MATIPMLPSGEEVELMLNVARNLGTGDDRVVAKKARYLATTVDRLGISLEGLISAAIQARPNGTPIFRPNMPTSALTAKSSRNWAAYLSSYRDQLNNNEFGFLKDMIRWSAKDKQALWLWKITYRMQPGACGNWGSPG